MASNHVPVDMVWLCVLVLLYSILCLSAGALLTYLLWRSGERFSYIILVAFFITTSTASTIIQQVHYAFDWVGIKQAEYERSVKDADLPSYARRGSAEIVDYVLSSIENYFYNVIALLVLFWAMALFKRTSNLKLLWLTERAKQISIASKLFAIFFPSITTVLARVAAKKELKYVYFFVFNVNYGISLIVGSILIILILYKYIKTRRQAAGRYATTPWWRSIPSTTLSRSTRSADSTHDTLSMGNEPTMGHEPTDSIYDHALILRFAIGFVTLGLYEGVIVGYQYVSITREEKALQGPDLSKHTIVSNLLFYTPGTTGSLVLFLVFGTTKALHKYRAFLDPVCCCLRQRQGGRPSSGARLSWMRLGAQKSGRELQTLEVPTVRPDLESRGRLNNSERVTASMAYGSHSPGLDTRTGNPGMQKSDHELQILELSNERGDLHSSGRLNGYSERSTVLSVYHRPSWFDEPVPTIHHSD